MSGGLSHITFIVSDLDRMQVILETVLDAVCVYESGAKQFSLSQERFYLVGEVWIATMLGDPLAGRSYNHVAFKIDESEFDTRKVRIEELGLELRPPRPRVTSRIQRKARACWRERLTSIGTW